MYISSNVYVVFTFVMALLAMAFFTLLERKVLGYAQLRKGPNKVGLMGLPQPLADALKLFTKELTSPSFSNLFPFFVAPMLGLFLALMLWSLYPHTSPSVFMMYSVLMFLCVSSFNVYTTLIAGWSSNSKYSLLGALRSAAQTISYEVSMSLILLSPLMFSKSLSLLSISNYQYIPVMVICPIFLFLWFITTLAETNRTPFDFSEGESELVSGFNTEYSGGSFALVFMAEYMNIIFMSLITSVLFFMMSLPLVLKDVWLCSFTLLFSFLFLWVRGTLPRMRYDRLMGLTWKVFLPLSLCGMVLSMVVSAML